MAKFDLEESDVLKISKAYENSPDKIEDLTAERFVGRIDGRLFTEFCFNTPSYKHRNYSGECFEEWVNEETHYQMERQGFNWIENEIQSIQNSIYCLL